MDTFMDSSWYWFRYLSPHRDDMPFDRELVDRWTPVDTYTGGIEHAILHLLYARFFTKVLRDLGLLGISEPFQRLRNQGMILGEDNEKMSKSRGNVVNPDRLVAEYGTDVVRTYLMFIGPWDQGAPWSYQGIEGVTRFLTRVWSLVLDPAEGEGRRPTRRPSRAEARRARRHPGGDRGLRGVPVQHRGGRAHDVAQRHEQGQERRRDRDRGLERGASYPAAAARPDRPAPHARSCGIGWGSTDSVHLQAWPAFDPEALVQDTITMAVQINGKVRGQIEVPADADQNTVLTAAREEPNVARYLGSGTVQREIVVPGKLVSFVVR